MDLMMLALSIFVKSTFCLVEAVAYGASDFVLRCRVLHLGLH